jgi:hypothetical protein
VPSAPSQTRTIPAARSRAVERDPAEDVRATLKAWLDATRQGDVAAQMAFYPRLVPVYYTWRNTPRSTVLAEKRKVFADARVLEGPRVHRRGEVLQELRWARTGQGWKITSERDAAVLEGDSHRARAARSRSPWPRLAGARAASGAPPAAGGSARATPRSSCGYW